MIFLDFRLMKKYSPLLLLILFAGCNKASSPVPPVATPLVATVDRSAASSIEFKISLDRPVSQDVSIDYATQPGTAVSPTDFVATTGTLTIPAGSGSGSIKVTIIPDSTRKDDQQFSILFSNARNCTLANSEAIGTISNANGSYFPVDDTGYSTPLTYDNYTLVWNDEFDGKTIDKAYWNFDIGNNNGWGNHELEYYTERAQNAFKSQGHLVMEARSEKFADFGFTSAKMTTKDKKTFTYGRVDIRAKLPKGKGIWPALWMLGNNIDQVSWPACGEIDIMELIGQQPSTVYGTMHWGATFANHQSYDTHTDLSSGTFGDAFHVYSLIWTAQSVDLRVDDVAYFNYDITSDMPFNQEFYLIFNIAVGGDWPGPPDASTVLPQRMVVDYIRVFQ